MKPLVVAATLLITFPSIAQEKVWVDATCQVMMVSANNQFTVARTDGTREIVCKIGNWPISQEQAEMNCSDGSHPKMSLHNGSVIFDGITLLPKGHQDILCD